MNREGLQAGSAGTFQSNPISVAVISENAAAQGDWAGLFASISRIRSTSQSPTIDAALSSIRAQAPDFILVDFSTGNRAHSFEALTNLRAALPKTPILVVADSDDERMFLAAFRAGIRAYWLQPVTAEQLEHVIRLALAGHAPIHPKVAAHALNCILKSVHVAHTHPCLTTRENQCLRLLAVGLSYKEIAAKMELPGTTVRNTLHFAYKKLRAANAADAVLKWLQAAP